MEEEYISTILLELQPRSRRCCRRLFGIRENKYFHKELFNIEQFTKTFLNQYNKKVLRRGEHIKCDQLIVAVKRIERSSSTNIVNTRVEFTLRGVPLKVEEKTSMDEKIVEKKGISNQAFVDDKTNENYLNVQIEENTSCYCCECKRCLSDGDLFIKSGNWTKPILCLPCYDLLFTHKCVRCSKPITFDHDSLTSDGLGCIRFVENNGLYWHSDCCVCVTCLESLVGKKYYQDQIYNQLFCLDHSPVQLE